MIRFVCPHCKKPAAVDEPVAGSVTTCPACGLRLQLPTPSPPPASPVNQAADAAGIPDEDEARLRAEVPDAFFPGTEKLGRPRFRVERQVLGQNAYKPAFALVLCCIPCLITLFEGPFLLRFLSLLFIAGFVTGAVLFVRYQRRKASAYAVVWTDGFVHFDGRKFTVWRWADVAVLNMQAVDQRTLWLLIETDRLLTKSYRLRHRDGTEYQFWSTQGARAAQFGLQVERETFRVLMPDVVARLNRGQSVPFSPFEVKVDGLVYQGEFTPWSDLRPARFDRGRLRLDGVGPAGGTVSVPLGKIDNAHVFLRLLERNVGFADEDSEDSSSASRHPS